MHIHPAFKTYKVWLPLVILVAALALIMPRNGKFEYVYAKGSQWNYPTLRAKFDFPILKTAEQFEAEKAALSLSRQRYYAYSPTVWGSISEHLRKSPANADVLLSHDIVRAIMPMYEKGVIGEDEPAVGENGEIPVIYIQRDKKIFKEPYAEVYTVNDVISSVRKVYEKHFGYEVSDSLLKNVRLESEYAPNILYDSKMTENVHKEKLEELSPTIGIFKSGNVIVSTGDMVTGDIEQILNSYKAEFEESIGYDGPKYLLWLGNFGMSAVLVILLTLLILFSKADMLEKFNEFYFVLTLFFLCTLVTVIVCGLEKEYLLLVPYPVFALFLMSFYRRRLVIPLYAIMLLPVLICGNSDSDQLYMQFLFGGFIAVQSFTFWSRGWKQFLAALSTFIAMLFVFFVFRLIGGSVDAVTYVDIVFIFLSALFCILAYPLIYLFEICFNLVSSNRLIELSDTNNELLRFLAMKAPGTFQHSIAVMNMAEYAGRSVDANIPLLRVGALYHDLGKTSNPEKFVENGKTCLADDEGKTLKEKAGEIIDHVREGLAIADKYSLPKIVSDFIATHHGTTCTGYFYNQYLNEGGDPEDVGDFYYPGPKPSTREQIILMLCDSVEAASRTISDYSSENVNKLVRSIYNDKYHNGQFGNSDITLKELDTVCRAIEDYLIQSHHQRIAYPNRKK